MIRSLISFTLFFTNVCHSQILGRNPNTVGVVEIDIIHRIRESIKQKQQFNSVDVQSVADELTLFCEEETSLCDVNSNEVIQNNMKEFTRVANLLDGDDAGIFQDLLEELIEAASEITSAFFVAVFDTVSMLIEIPLDVVSESIRILSTLLSSILDALTDIEVRMLTGLLGTAEANMRMWSDVLEEDEGKENSSRLRPGLLFPKEENYDELLEKREKLAKIVQFSTYGYILGEGDPLTSAQFSTSAYVQLS